MKPHLPVSMPLALALLAAFGPAQAQVAGQAMVQIGYGREMPRTHSDDLGPPAAPGMQVDFHPAGAAVAAAAYMFTDNWAGQFTIDTPYRHDIFGAGTVAGAGKLGSVQQFTSSFMLQYRFLPAYSVFRPYVGAGIAYAMFFGTEGSSTLTALVNPGGRPVTIGSDRSIGVSAQVGMTWKFNERYYADVAVSKSFLKTSEPLSAGPSISARLDPVTASISLGYRF